MRKKLTLLIACAFAGFSAYAQNLVVNGGFELPDDGSKHLFITERAGWFSDDMTSNQNGTEHGTAMVGNYYQYCINTAGTIYQPIDKVSDKAATYKVSYLSGVTYNPDSGNDTIYSVAYFSHYSPGNIGSRTLIDSIATDITSESWKSQINVEFNIPAAAAYAGDSLVIEFATRVWDHITANTNTWTNMDSVVVVKVTTFNLPIVNGGFELPDDGLKHLFITERAGWFSDDMTSNHNGAEHNTNMVGNYNEFSINTAGTIYQPIDIVTNDSADYTVKYLSGLVYNPDPGNDTIYTVAYLSHYSSGNIKTRTIIDSVATDMTSESWKTEITAAFKIPAGAAYAGDSLALEFATRVWDHHTANTNTWTGMDSVVVIKTGDSIPSAPTHLWTTFQIAKVLDGANLPADHNASMKLRWDEKNMYVDLSVEDDSIVTAGGQIYEVDNIEVYFDINNGKLALQPRNSTPWPPAWQSVAGYYQERLVPGFPYDSSAMGNKIKGVTQIYKYDTINHIYTFELTYPWDSIKSGFVPTLGDSIGFDIDLSINTGNPFYRNQISWNAPFTNIYLDPASWGTLKFSAGGLFTNVLDKTAPTLPSGLAVLNNKTTATLSWTASTDNIVVQNYILYDGTTAIDTVVAKLTGNSFAFKGLSEGVHTLGVQATDLYWNKSGKATIKDTIVISGIKESTFTFEISPNPVNDILNIKSNDLIKTVSIVNLTGQVVNQTNFNDALVRLNVVNLQRGIYLVRVQTSKGISVQRIVKQ